MLLITGTVLSLKNNIFHSHLLYPEKHLTTSFYHQLQTKDFFTNSKGDPGVDDKWNDYWLQLCRDGRKNWWEMSEDMQEQTYLMDMNKAPFDMDDNILIGNWQAKTYHVDAERFMK